MTQKTPELDADIARLIAQHRNRQTLGWSYWNVGTDPEPKKTGSTRKQRDAKARYRARKAAALLAATRAVMGDA